MSQEKNKPKRAKVLKIALPKENFASELLRVFKNEVHGDIVLSLHDNGKAFLTVYDTENKNYKTHTLDFTKEYPIVTEDAPNA
jgi:hypothetical protein